MKYLHTIQFTNAVAAAALAVESENPCTSSAASLVHFDPVPASCKATSALYLIPTPLSGETIVR